MKTLSKSFSVAAVLATAFLTLPTILPSQVALAENLPWNKVIRSESVERGVFPKPDPYKRSDDPISSQPLDPVENSRSQATHDPYAPTRRRRAADTYEPNDNVYRPAPRRRAAPAPRYEQRPYAERPYTPPPRQYRPNPPYRGDYQPRRRSTETYRYRPEPPVDVRPQDRTYSNGEILSAGHSFFGKVTKGLASVIEYAFSRSGRPTGYILGQEGGGAFVAGLRYGEGTLHTKFAGSRPIYWQGPSIGYDFGAEGSKTMTLIYNLNHPDDIFSRYSGVDGSAYLVGGVGITYLQNGEVVAAPIRSGVGLRLGANIGYLKFTRRPTWNPF